MQSVALKMSGKSHENALRDDLPTISHSILANVNFFLVNLLNSVVFYRLLGLLQLDVTYD